MMKTTNLFLNEDQISRTFKQCMTSIRREDSACFSIYSLIQVDWPEAVEAMKILYGYLSAIPSIADTPVIVLIIKDGLNAYNHARLRVKEHQHSDLYRMAAFIDGMVSSTCKHMQVTIIDAAYDEWSVKGQVAFTDWYSPKRGPYTVKSDVVEDTERLRHLIYSLLSLNNIKSIMSEEGYAEAIVAGRLDTGL